MFLSRSMNSRTGDRLNFYPAKVISGTDNELRFEFIFIIFIGT